jgi:hypothetical protein
VEPVESTLPRIRRAHTGVISLPKKLLSEHIMPALPPPPVSIVAQQRGPGQATPSLLIADPLAPKSAPNVSQPGSGVGQMQTVHGL